MKCLKLPLQQQQCPYHEEGVANPQAAPARGTLRDGDVLAVHSHSLGRGFTHRAPADVLGDLEAVHGHHGDGGSGGQPVGLVIPAGIVAHLVDVAVNKRHGAEAGQTGASKTWENHRSGHSKRLQTLPVTHTNISWWGWHEWHSSQGGSGQAKRPHLHSSPLHCQAGWLWKCHFGLCCSPLREFHQLTEILVVCLLLALHIQQAVAIPEFVHAHGAGGDVLGLAVLDQGVSHGHAPARHSRQTGGSRLPHHTLETRDNCHCWGTLGTPAGSVPHCHCSGHSCAVVLWFTRLYSSKRRRFTASPTCSLPLLVFFLCPPALVGVSGLLL